GAAAGAGVVLGFSLVAVGPSGIGVFVAAVAKPSYSPVAKMQSATGLFGALLGGGSAAYALAYVAIVACLGTCGWLGHASGGRTDLLEPALAAALALSLFAAPHLLGHDLTLLAPALVWGLAWQASRSGAPWPDRQSIAALAAWVLLSIATLNDLGQE